MFNGAALVSLLVLTNTCIAAEQNEGTFSDWFWHATGSVPAAHFNDEGSPYRFALGAGRSGVADHLSLMANLVLGVYDVNAVADNNPSQNVKGGYSSSLGFDLLARWDLERIGNFNCYLEGGAGFQNMLGNPRFPADASNQNFTLFVGPGVYIPTGTRSRLSVSIQLFHISNADLFENNSGYDGLQLKCGSEWSF